MKNEEHLLEENRSQWEEEYSHLPLSSDFMFGHVMSMPRHCKRLLGLISNIRVEGIRIVTPQRTISNTVGGKYVRLDIMIEEGGNVRDIEMQCQPEKALPVRSRCYASSMDQSWIEAGTEYDDIGYNNVDFFCLYDPKGKGLWRYTFDNSCREDRSITLDDRCVKTFYNCKAWALCPDPELMAFLHYLYDGTITSDWTRELDKDVQNGRLNKEWRKTFMDEKAYRNMCIREGYDKGYDKGYEKAKKEYTDQLAAKDNQIAAKDNQIAAKDNQIAAFNSRIAALETIVANLGRPIPS